MTVTLPERTTLLFKRARWVVFALAALSILFGLAVLVGWAAQLPALVRLRADLPPMQFNTALCFVLAGMGLLAWVRRRRHYILPILGGLVALISGATLIQYLTGLNLRIDELCFSSPFLEPGAHPGRMSAISAFCLFLTGVGLVRLRAREGKHYPWIVGTIASIVMSAAFIALIGYIFDLPVAYQWGQINRIAPHAAAGFIVLACGLLIVAWLNGCMPGENTPRWLPIPLGLGISICALVLAFALNAKQKDALHESLLVESENLQREMKTQLENRAKTLSRMAHRWGNSGMPLRSTWEFDATLYTRDFPDLQAVEWIDASGLIRWIVPLAGNEAKVNLDAAREARRAAAMQRARVDRHPAFTGAVSLFRGGTGTIIYTPIHRNDGAFEGWIAAVFEVQTFLGRSLPASGAEAYALRVSDGDHVMYARENGAPLPSRPGQIARAKIEMAGATWDLMVWPTPLLVKRSISALPWIVMAAGFFVALLLAGICYLAQRYSRISRAKATIAEAFQLALEEVKTLAGLLPICSCCKRVREDSGYWSQIDTYLDHHTDAQLSHGYCPECAARTFTEFGLKIPDRVNAELLARNFE